MLHRFWFLICVDFVARLMSTFHDHTDKHVWYIFMWKYILLIHMDDLIVFSVSYSFNNHFLLSFLVEMNRTYHIVRCKIETHTQIQSHVHIRIIGKNQRDRMSDKMKYKIKERTTKKSSSSSSSSSIELKTTKQKHRQTLILHFLARSLFERYRYTVYT